MVPSWMAERRRDPYYRAAQREGFRSRAAFKLGQLDERFHILHAGDRVLDLGASPGGWSLMARERIGPRGSVTSVDMRGFDPAEGIVFVKGRVGDPALLARLGDLRFQVVLSDMAPSLSGNYSVDHARSVELVELAWELAREVLAREGAFVAKVFQGDLVDDLRRTLEPEFERFQVSKPKASRGASSEMYLIGRRWREPRGRAADQPSGSPTRAAVEGGIRPHRS